MTIGNQNDNYSIVYEFENNKSEVPCASNETKQISSSQDVRYKLDMYKRKLLEIGNTEKWQCQVNRWLNEFIQSCNPYNEESVLDYLSKLKERYNYVTYIKRFTQIKKFLKLELKLDYWNGIKIKRADAPVVKTVTNLDIKQAIVQLSKGKRAMLCKTVLLLCGATGIRPSELVRIQREDIDLNGRTLKVRQSKTTSEPRLTFFDARTMRVLEVWMRKNKNRILFNETMIARAFKNSAIKVKDGRKYFIQSATRLNMNQTIIDFLTGHAPNTVSSQYYCSLKNLSVEELRDIYDRTFGRR